MIREETGGRPKVIGSSMAMVAIGPRPGSTPTAVPSSTPMKQYIRLNGLSAVAKPSPRSVNSSMGDPSYRDGVGSAAGGAALDVGELATGDQWSRLSQGPVRGSGNPRRRMNRNAQNAASPTDSSRELRNAA